MTSKNLPPFEFVDFAEMEGVSCPCGVARRGLEFADDIPFTIHVTDIKIDAQKHFHRSHAEVYYILEAEPDAKLELGDQVFPVKPGDCVLIRPGTAHRALGKMKVLIVSMPKFDPLDEVIVGDNA